MHMTLEKLVDLATRHRNLFIILLGSLLYLAFAGFHSAATEWPRCDRYRIDHWRNRGALV